MTEQSRLPNWFQRHWKWLLPAGCLGTLLAAGVFVVGVVFLVFGAMTRSDVYQQALTTAQEHPAVREAIGEPVRAGWFVSGSVSSTGPSGEANLAIPISGPRGKATLFAVATRSAGRWHFQTLEVEVSASGTRISLQHPLALRGI